ncbi:MAG: hypothetical protein ACYC56_11330 [Candidatus Aquicultor sp.]
MTSKDWTLNDALGFLRVLTNQIGTTKIQNNFVIDALHSSLAEVMQFLSVTKIFDYGIKTTLPVTVSGKYGTASISGFTVNPVNKIVKIVDSSQVAGERLCVEVTQAQFDNLKNILQSTTGTIFWARNGNDINFYGGDLTIGATLDLYYIGYPKKVTTTTDYLEIKDVYLGLVLAKTKLKIYEILQSSPPDSINQGVNNQIAFLRNTNLEDQTNTK